MRSVQKPLSGKLVAGLNISVFTALPDAQPAWTTLEATGLCSVYQTYHWCQSWLETIGSAANIQPVILVACATDGTPKLLLPFQVRRRFGLRVLEWLTQPDCNYGHGIFCLSHHNWQDWFKVNGDCILGLLPPFDVAHLLNAPVQLMGTPNPFCAINRFASANHSFITRLVSDFDELHHTKRTAKSISKIRRRDERLAEMGPLLVETLQSANEAKAALAECLKNKTTQLAEIGVHGFNDQNLTVFFGKVLEQNTDLHHALLVFRLRQNGQTIASLIGATNGDVFSLIILSMPGHAPRQFSPGDYLLRKSIAWACQNGFKFYDFSNGHSTYKEIWADDEIELFDYFGARTLRGLPMAATHVALSTAKRVIKNNAMLKSVYFKLREIIAGKS